MFPPRTCLMGSAVNAAEISQYWDDGCAEGARALEADGNLHFCYGVNPDRLVRTKRRKAHASQRA